MCACPKPAQTYTVCVPRTVAQTSASVDAKPGTNVAVAAAQPKMPWYLIYTFAKTHLYKKV